MSLTVPYEKKEAPTIGFVMVNLKVELAKDIDLYRESA